jgi:hypothetical protein
MTPVPWETDHVKAVYEDMVAVLLSTLHPDAERLDGRGGDGGRDVQLRRDGRLDLFELKSFTGRLGKEQGRRVQVERSLKRAAQLHPDTWTLVVPIDHTEGELAWFDGLRRCYPFPLVWRGRTWLDGQMATHPAIVRYYLEGGDSHVVRVLRELQQEQAVLAGGIPDALQRLQVLRQRIDELSPHYRLDIAIAGDTITVQVQPRYRGAERDHPMLITGGFAFPDTPTGREAAQRLERAFDYGDEVVIEPDYVRDLHVDLPGGLGEEITNPKIILGPAAEDAAFRLDGRATISDPAGAPLGSLALRFNQRQAGRRGGMLSAQDFTGILRLQVRVDTVTRKGNIGFQLGEPAEELLPGALLPTLRVLRHFHAPNRLELQIGGTRALQQPTLLPQVEPVTDAFLALVEDLERVQVASQAVFPLPRELTREDMAAIRRAARLLGGERVAIATTGQATFTIALTDPQFFEKLVVDDRPVSFTFTEGNYTETIAGVEVPLGPAFATLSSATVANRAELLATRPWHADQQLAVAVQPLPGVQLEVLLARSGNGDSA